MRRLSCFSILRLKPGIRIRGALARIVSSSLRTRSSQPRQANNGSTLWRTSNETCGGSKLNGRFLARVDGLEGVLIARAVPGGPGQKVSPGSARAGRYSPFEEGTPFTRGAWPSGVVRSHGGGARRCIGMAFAQFEMKLVISRILSSVELALVDKRSVRPMRRGLTAGPSPVRLVVRDSLPAVRTRAVNRKELDRNVAVVPPQ